MDRRKSPSRAAFTLVEVLVVILIIGILISLLVPAVIASIRKAREAQVTAEINNLATALASFKNLYGDYPPSRIVLCERGYTFAGVLTNANPASVLPDTNCTDITMAQLAQRTLVYMNRFWPRADLISDPTGGTGSAPVGSFNDFDGDGLVSSNVVVLSGSECLAFFLGGIPIKTLLPTGGVSYGASGFSKSPTFPFVDPVTAPNRSVAIYEFNAGRLLDLDGDHLPSYLDPLNTVQGSQRAYAYFSSYGSNSYDPNDVNGYDHNASHAIDYEIDPNDPNLMNICEWGFTVGYPVTNGTVTSNAAVSPSPNPYTTSLTGANSVSWINPTTFQIICSGQDTEFGYGGIFLQTGSNPTPLPYETSGQVYSTYSSPNRLIENDNITNFSTGRLN